MSKKNPTTFFAEGVAKQYSRLAAVTLTQVWL